MWWWKSCPVKAVYLMCRATRLPWNQPSVPFVSKKKLSVTLERCWQLSSVTETHKEAQPKPSVNTYNLALPGSANHEGAFKRDGCWMRASFTASASTDLPLSESTLGGYKALRISKRKTNKRRPVITLWTGAEVWLGLSIIFLSAQNGSKCTSKYPKH